MAGSTTWRRPAWSHTPAAIRRAARYGSGWLPIVLDLDPVTSGATALRELTRGRRCPTIAHAFSVRIERPDEPAGVQSTTPWMPPPVAGSPNAIAQHVEQYRRAGLDYALCGFESEDLDDLLRQMRTFADQVAPRFIEPA
jgi:alkanesulfonate monooxygenase SsuD/methylene tetrahydromethanopterin reductase-like flavin-dependent oxidoreductase (luciferase family)